MYEDIPIIPGGPFRATKLWNDAVKTFYNGMPTCKHWRGLKQYENCFTGKEAVDWMIEYLTGNRNFGTNITREQATKLLSKFLGSHVISSIKGYASPNDNFSDNRDLYMLSSQSPLTALRSPVRPPLVPITSVRLHNNASCMQKENLNVPFAQNSDQRKKDELQECEKIVISGATLWRDVLFNRLEEVYSRLIIIRYGDSTFVPKEYINGNFVWRNMVNVGQVPKYSQSLESSDLPSWILTAMKSMKIWPESSGSACSLPDYEGVEIDVFKIVRDYYTSMNEPLIPCELYESIVKLFMGAQLLDIANRSSPPRLVEAPLSPKLSTGSVEDLMLDLSINVAATPSIDIPSRLYESVKRPTSVIPLSPSQSPRVPQHSGYDNFKDPFFYPCSDSSTEGSDGRLTLRSLKNKGKIGRFQRPSDNYIRSDELENFPLPPNSCFEAAFTSDSPITRVIPQKSVDTIHYSLSRRKGSSEFRHHKRARPSEKTSRWNFRDRSLSEDDLLSADSYTVQSSQSDLRGVTSSKTLASRVRDSLLRKKGGKSDSKRTDRRGRRYMSVAAGGLSVDNSTECLLQPTSFDHKYATLDSRAGSIGRPCSSQAEIESGFVTNDHSPSIDDDAFSSDSKYSALSLRRGKYSPAFSANSCDTLIYSVRSGSSCKVSTPNACLSHSLASPHSSYHSVRSNLNAAGTFPGSKSTDLLEESLDLSSKGFNIAETSDVSLTPILPRREPVIVHSPVPNIAINQLINDYENVPGVPKLWSSYSDLSDKCTDCGPCGVVGPGKESVLEHYLSTPSKELPAPRLIDTSDSPNACLSPGLLTKAGIEFCTEALQLILLLLEPARRHKLFLLMQMIRKLAQNDQIQLDPKISTRDLMIETFCQTVFANEHGHSFNRRLSSRVTSFIMDAQDVLFTPPTELLLKAHERQKECILGNGFTYCQQVSLETYAKQKLSGSDKFLADLLDQIVEDPNWSSKERQRKLKGFQLLYPEIYKYKFPEEGVAKAEKKGGSKFKKLHSLSKISKGKSFGI